MSWQQVQAYWDSVGVDRKTLSLQESPGGDEFYRAMREVGLPDQKWWAFKFTRALLRSKDRVQFGKMWDGWNLWIHEKDGAFFFEDEEHRERFGNSSFLAFNQFLVLFDQGYRTHEAANLGDSGEDWDKGAVMVQEMESQMRAADSRAFENSELFWPKVIEDMEG